MLLRASARLWAVALLALLSVALVQQSAARLGIVWRLAVVSWDSPATQLEDEVASQGLLHDDPARRARAHALAALVPADRLWLPAPPSGPRAVAGLARLTRAPPPV
jgi:hypothetical protein